MTNEIEYIVDEYGCHICTSHVFDKNGYPKITRDRKYYRVSRYLWEQTNGGIPDGFLIRHKCDNPNCINIDHLETGTPKQNSEDMTKRNRQCKGEDQHKSVLTELKVKEIRKIYASGLLSQREIAKKFNVSRGAVRGVLKNRTWRYL